MKNLLLSISISFFAVVTFGQEFSTSKSSLNPTSKQYAVDWNISDTLISFKYTHPKMIKTMEKYGGVIENNFTVDNVKTAPNGGKIYYVKVLDIRQRITLVADKKNNSYIVLYETFDEFKNEWSQATYYN